MIHVVTVGETRKIISLLDSRNNEQWFKGMARSPNNLSGYSVVGLSNYSTGRGTHSSKNKKGPGTRIVYVIGFEKKGPTSHKMVKFKLSPH